MNRPDDQLSTTDGSYASSGGPTGTGTAVTSRWHGAGQGDQPTGDHPDSHPAAYQGGYPTQPLHGGHDQHGGYAAPQHDPWATPGGPTPPGGDGSGDGSGGGGGGRGPRRRPGWAGVAGVAIAGAVAASALTAGLLGAFGQDASTTGSSAASASGATIQGVSETTVNWQAVVDSVSPSVVAVSVSSSTASGVGSGIVYDAQGHVVTNNHVVSGAGSNAQIVVTLSDGRQYQATVVGTDPATDLAVLQLQDPPADLRPATFADSDEVVPGQAVMALGNPLGLAGSATTGIVSAVDRPVLTTAETESQQSPFGSPYGQQTSETVATNAIQTDAAINPGNSGGALLDSSGRVIGVNSSIASLSSSASSQSGSIGLGFAIPSNEVAMIADQLVEDGTAEHAWLGVSLTQEDPTVTAGGQTRTGTQVAAVSEGTPAAEAGVQVGDVITAVDGSYTAGYEALTAAIREKAVGSEVELTVVRDGREETLTATLTARPES
ncbi:S1C family serine protease [Kineococcus sp. SYSU DK018]|uniref:S1C family serine protease n=1 Tax=Kineococcus sp. SYSU DK018 TaxID=3383139 RepID=UPI003D7C40A0